MMAMIATLNYALIKKLKVINLFEEQINIHLLSLHKIIRSCLPFLERAKNNSLAAMGKFAKQAI